MLALYRNHGPRRWILIGRLLMTGVNSKSRLEHKLLRRSNSLRITTPARSLLAPLLPLHPLLRLLCGPSRLLHRQFRFRSGNRLRTLKWCAPLQFHLDALVRSLLHPDDQACPRGSRPTATASRRSARAPPLTFRRPKPCTHDLSVHPIDENHPRIWSFRSTLGKHRFPTIGLRAVDVSPLSHHADCM
jgi:hypothetical protein